MSANGETQTTRRRFIEILGASGLVLQGSLLGVGCKKDPDGEDTAEDERFWFAVITDTHVQSAEDNVNNQFLATTIEILNDFEVPLDFVVLTGDAVDQLPSDDPAYYEQNTTAIHRLRDLLDGLAMPWHVAMGNHDYFTNTSMDNTVTSDKPAREALFASVLGMPGPWYRFDHEGIAFIVLNTMQQDSRATWSPDSCGSFGEEQLAWLDEQMDAADTCFLLFHHPLALDEAASVGAMAYRPFEVPRAEGHYEKYEGTEQEGWTDPIYELLERRADQVAGIFVGHGHWFIEDTWQGFGVRMGDSVGNSYEGSTRGEGDDAEPMRYHVVECNLTRGTFTIYNRAWIEYNR